MSIHVRLAAAAPSAISYDRDAPVSLSPLSSPLATASSLSALSHPILRKAGDASSPYPHGKTEAQTKAARNAHARAVHLAKKQAKIYARDRKRERKSSRPFAVPASPLASPIMARRVTGSVGDCLEIVGSSGRQGPGADNYRPKDVRRSSDSATTRPRAPASPLGPSLLRGLAEADRAWSSLHSLPDALPSEIVPLAEAWEELAHLSASQANLELPPIASNDGGGRGGPGGSDTADGSGGRLLDAGGAIFPDPPLLHFYPLWKCPFQPAATFAKKRSAAVSQMLAAYRRLQATTESMLHKVDGLLLKEYMSGEAALKKRHIKELKVEMKRLNKLSLSHNAREKAELEYRDSALKRTTHELLQLQCELLCKHADVLMTRSCLMQEVQHHHLVELRSLDFDALIHSLADAHNELEAQLKTTRKALEKALNGELRQRKHEAKKAGVPFDKEARSHVKDEHSTQVAQHVAEERVGLNNASEQRKTELTDIYATLLIEMDHMYDRQAEALQHYKDSLDHEAQA